MSGMSLPRGRIPKGRELDGRREEDWRERRAGRNEEEEDNMLTEINLVYDVLKNNSTSRFS